MKAADASHKNGPVKNTQIKILINAVTEADRLLFNTKMPLSPK